MGVALIHLERSDIAGAVSVLERALAPLVEPTPPIAEDPAVIARRELETKEARERCAVALGGHLFYAARDYCARCFEPKPAGWEG